MLLDYNGNEPIKKEDFLDIVKACDLLQGDSDDDISALFDELDYDKDGRITLSEFINSMSEENSSPRYRRFFKAVLDKEVEIHEFKDKKRNNDALQYRRAFFIINFNGLKPINRKDFEAVVERFSLVQGASDEKLKALFKSLDKDNDGELSSEEFLQCLHTENPIFDIKLFADAIFNQEANILEYKKSKGRKHTQGTIL